MSQKRINNQKNRQVFYPNNKYRILIHKLNIHMGFNSCSKTSDYINREFFNDRPELVAKLDKLNIEDND